jgi:hypothetical protein
LKPVKVTEVKNGEVLRVVGSTILVRTAEGFRNFTQGEVAERGVRIMRAGQPAELSDVHVGDKVTAVIIASMPP